MNKSQRGNQASANYYLASPKSNASAGVIVLHAWWGLNPFFRDMCDRLAGQGFLAMAPDLYHGAIASTVSEAKRLRSKLKRAVVAQEIQEAANQLRAQPSIRGHGIGVIGFSLGAYWALWLAEQKSIPIAATVIFYGTRNGDYAQAQSAFLGHFAEDDEWVSAASVKKLHKSLSAAGKQAAFYTYPGAGHWFFEKDRSDAYKARAAHLAWDRTIEFLRTCLT